jgi:copper chaperone CopZ
MSCNHCKNTVEKAVRSVSGVESVEVSLEQGQVVVTGSAHRDQLIKAIEEAGYDVVR